MLTLLLLAGGLYASVVLLAAAFQARLLFPTFAVSASDGLPPGSTRLSLSATDGVRLQGLHIAPAASRPRPKRLLAVVFPGNAWNADDAAELVHRLWPAADVVAFHYRGYAPSGGSASARGLLADAPTVLDAARKRVPDARVVAVGFSIGSGVAASLVVDSRVDGAVLVTPFDRLRAVGRGHYPWLPVRLFFRHDMNPAADLARADVPVALISAGQDTIIPPERTAALRGAARNLVYDRTLHGAGHNDLYAQPEFGRAMDEAVAAVLTRPSGAGPRSR